MKELFAAFILSLLLPLTTFAQEYGDGHGYQTIATPVPTNEPNKVQVVEIFWYGCSHCFLLEPYTQTWGKTIPSYVNFQYLPAVFSPNWLNHAKAFYMAKLFGIESKLHSKLYDAIHVYHRPLKTESALAQFFTHYGVSKKEFKKQFNSFAIQSRLTQADARIRGYGVQGTPTFVVNGKYLVDAKTAGNNKNIYNVVNYLIQKEHNKIK